MKKLLAILLTVLVNCVAAEAQGNQYYGMFFGNGVGLTNVTALQILDAANGEYWQFQVDTNYPSSFLLGNGTGTNWTVGGGGTLTQVYTNNTLGVVVKSNLNVLGTNTASYFYGNGSSLTSLNADNISSGTLNSSRLPTTATFSALNVNGNAQINGLVVTNTATFGGNATFTNNVTVQGQFTGNGAGLTNYILNFHASLGSTSGALGSGENGFSLDGFNGITETLDAFAKETANFVGYVTNLWFEVYAGGNAIATNDLVVYFKTNSVSVSSFSATLHSNSAPGFYVCSNLTGSFYNGAASNLISFVVSNTAAGSTGASLRGHFSWQEIITAN